MLHACVSEMCHRDFSEGLVACSATVPNTYWSNWWNNEIIKSQNVICSADTHNGVCSICDIQRGNTMMTSSNGDTIHGTGPFVREFFGEFPAQRPVTQIFDVFFELCLNKRLSEQSWGWWFETPSRSLWRHFNAYICYISMRFGKSKMSSHAVSDLIQSTWTLQLLPAIKSKRGWQCCQKSTKMYGISWRQWQNKYQDLFNILWGNLNALNTISASHVFKTNIRTCYGVQKILL